MIRFTALLLCAITVNANAAGLGEPLIFTGTCDASAATGLDTNLFVVASDEDNVLRFYRPNQAGKPVFKYDLRPVLALSPKSPETDLEGAARLGQCVFFISSHGRNAEGKYAPNRHRLFALELTQPKGRIRVQPVGKPYTRLVEDLARDPKYTRFRLAEAALRAPKSPGGFNIEALAETPEGGLLIGFRSPIPDHRALLAPLLNPEEVINGQPPRFGDPILLDLGGLGLRDMCSTPDGYYLIAGPDAGHKESHSDSRLFTWKGGNSVPQPVSGLPFHKVNPEGICLLDVTNRSDFLIISDDGKRKMNGQECKKLPESERQFRAYRFTP
jgi:Protein of unknown function (DUF3616)